MRPSASAQPRNASPAWRSSDSPAAPSRRHKTLVCSANDITVTHEFGSVEAAQAFAKSDELKKAMQGAGVVSAPTIWFTNRAQRGVRSPRNHQAVDLPRIVTRGAERRGIQRGHDNLMMRWQLASRRRVGSRKSLLTMTLKPCRLPLLVTTRWSNAAQFGVR